MRLWPGGGGGGLFLRVELPPPPADWDPSGKEVGGPPRRMTRIKCEGTNQKADL